MHRMSSQKTTFSQLWICIADLRTQHWYLNKPEQGGNSVMPILDIQLWGTHWEDSFPAEELQNFQCSSSQPGSRCEGYETASWCICSARLKHRSSRNKMRKFCIQGNELYSSKPFLSTSEPTLEIAVFCA